MLKTLKVNWFVVGLALNLSVFFALMIYRVYDHHQMRQRENEAICEYFNQPEMRLRRIEMTFIGGRTIECYFPKERR